MKIIGDFKSKKAIQRLEFQYPDIVLVMMTSRKTCICVSVIKSGQEVKYDFRTILRKRGGEMAPTKKGVRFTEKQFSSVERAITNVKTV